MVNVLAGQESGKEAQPMPPTLEFQWVQQTAALLPAPFRAFASVLGTTRPRLGGIDRSVGVLAGMVAGLGAIMV